MKLHLRLFNTRSDIFLTKDKKEIACRLSPFVSFSNFRKVLEHAITDNTTTDVYILLPNKALRKHLRETKQPVYASYYFINENSMENFNA